MGRVATPSIHDSKMVGLNSIQKSHFKCRLGWQMHKNRGFSGRRVSNGLGFESLEGRCLLAVGLPTSESYPVDSNPSAFVVGDFNNDGLPDVATATEFGTVNILLDHAGADFSSGTTLHLGTGDSATGIAAADFEGAGNLDLAVSYWNNGATVTTGLLIFKGNGDGTFQAPVSIPTANPTSFALGDFNGDGKPDIAILEPSGLNILLNSGNGHFDAPVVYPAYSTGGSGSPFGLLSQQITVADLNGDGMADLAVATKDANGNPIVVTYQNAGNGTFDDPVAIPGATGATLITAQAFAGNGNGPQPVDLNGDGHTDLVGITATGMLGVSLNNGDGSFSTTTSDTAQSPRGLGVADFSAAGNQDIAVLGGSQVSISTNNGDGTFGGLRPALACRRRTPNPSRSPWPTSTVTASLMWLFSMTPRVHTR